MPFNILENNTETIPDAKREKLTITIHFNQWVLDSDIIIIQKQLEKWFVSWLKDSNYLYEAPHRDEFFPARSALIDAIDFGSLPVFEQRYFVIEPGFILHKIDTGSLRKDLFVALFAASISSAVSSTVSLYPDDCRRVLKVAIVDTTQALSSFVSHIDSGGSNMNDELINSLSYATQFYGNMALMENMSVTITAEYDGRKVNAVVDNRHAKDALANITEHELRKNR